MEKENVGREVLTSNERFIHDTIISWREEHRAGPPGNKYLAGLLLVSRKEVRRLRKSVQRKLKLPQGF